MPKNKDISIHKADKCNTVVILDKCSYISAIEEIHNDNSKCSRLIDKSTYKSIKIIDKSTYKSIKPVDSRPGILYVLGKIDQETLNEITPFWPTLSATGTPTYKLAKFLLKFLTPSTANEFTVIDSFQFAEEICQQDSNLHMSSLGVDFLFTDITLEKQSIFVLTTCTMYWKSP